VIARRAFSGAQQRLMRENLDSNTTRIGINSRLLDDFDAALAAVMVIDGKHHC